MQPSPAPPKKKTPSSQHDPFAATPADGEQEPEAPKVMRRLEIITRRRVENLFAGAYQAQFQGQGMIFADVRPYQPGDEVRWIDWNVSARMGELYIKQFVEERERTVLLVWDASPSMDLGTRRRSKRELCAELAMLLSLSAIHNGDRVGLIIFSGKVERFIAPQRGRKHVMRMIRELLEFKPTEDEHTDIKEALLFLQRVSPRHTIAFVLSDFHASHEEGIWQMLAKRCEMIPLVLIDRLERVLPGSPTDPDAIDEESPLASALQDPPEISPLDEAREETGGAMAISVALGIACLTLGLWQGGSWQWSGVVALLLCLANIWFLQRPKAGAICQLQDLETRRPALLDLTHSQAHQHYEQQAQEHIARLAHHFRRLQIDPVYLPTERDYMPILLRYFRQRRRASR